MKRKLTALLAALCITAVLPVHAGGPAADLPRRGADGAAAAAGGVAVPAAFAGVHGAHQHEPAGEGHGAGGPGDGDLTILQRLTQHLQGFPGENSGSCQKEDPVVGQGDLTRPGFVPPPASPMGEMVWWGERKGRRLMRGWSGSVRPAIRN